ncbi:MAG: LacI family DNA-binding transcriptional regulator [Caldilineaceae bacterium]|nr:LacI family DNA-binding transcriptional regulator [Caldilineaceae bacterium]
MRNRRVTIVEIAREAGVSAQTVSRVVNGHVNVAEETRLRVQEIIDRRGYHPSRLARSLLSGSSNTIGVVSFGLGLYGPSQTLAGIVRQANQQGYTVLPQMLTDAITHNPQRIVGQFIESHVDGVIWAVPEIGNNLDWVVDSVAEFDLPIVFITMQRRPGVTSVRVDNRRGGRQAVDHLIARGRRKLGLINGSHAWWEAQERDHGWRESLIAHDLPVDDTLIAEGDWSAASGEVALSALLARHPDVDGVFVANDSMALGAIKAARSLGRRVPEDVAVVGFDDMPESAFFYPALTTIHQDLDRVGSQAVGALHALLNGAVDPNPDGDEIVIGPRLVVRESA